jgi:RNA polymerase sigma-70 factor (ECF subfamily)
LLKLISKDDERAYETLYYRYYSYLCNKAYKRIAEEKVVEELVQDVFINCWHKRHEFDLDGNISAWLFATLRNKVLHELRSTYNRHLHTSRLKVLAEENTINDVPDYLDAKTLEAKILHVINSLPAQCQQAFRLSRFENISYKEIALRMNISVKTVEKHISKALQVLKSELHEYNLGLILLFWVLS